MRQNQFQAPAQTTTTPTKTIEKMFAAIMAKTDRQNEHYNQKFNNMQASISKLEVQMGQMASTMSQREQERFSSQPEVSPREHGQLKAITTLRSGGIIDH